MCKINKRKTECEKATQSGESSVKWPETILAWPWTSWPSLLLSPAKVGFLVKLVEKPNENTSTPTPEHTGHNHAGLF